MEIGRDGVCVPARVTPTRAHPSLNSPRTMCVYLVWKRRCADVRAGTQAPPLRFRLGDCAQTVGFVLADYVWMVDFVWVDYVWMVDFFGADCVWMVDAVWADYVSTVNFVWVDCARPVGIVPALFCPYASAHSPFYAFYFCSVYFFNG